MRIKRTKKQDITRLDLLDGLAQISRIITSVHHEHVVRHVPISPPVSATVRIKRPDGSHAIQYYLNCGKGAFTSLNVPAKAIFEDASPADFVQLEFRWERIDND